MQKTFTSYKYAILFSFLFFVACNQKMDHPPKVENTIDRYARTTQSFEWNNMFKYRKNWFGGDGIFAIPLDGVEAQPATSESETMLLFGDTLIGDMEGDSLTGEDYIMINNSVAFLKGNETSLENIEFYWPKDEEGTPVSLFRPNTPATVEGDYYWLGDGFVNTEADSTLYLFAHRIRNMETNTVFKFKQVGLSIIAIPNGSEAPFTEQRQMDTPFLFKNDIGRDIVFGSGILVNTKSAGVPNPDGYIYVYGTVDFTLDLHVMRVLPKNFEIFDQWQFWNGVDWTAEKTESVPITKGTARELSVSALPDGRFILVHQNYGFIPQIFIKIGMNPWGPFSPQVEIWECLEHNEDFDYFAYNAKAHPHLSVENELLISYNVNSFDFFNDILRDPTLYRPRFLKIKL